MHTGKDLAVALVRYRTTIPIRNSSPFGLDVSVRTSRITPAGVTRYPAPCKVGLQPHGRVRTFLSLLAQTVATLNENLSILYHIDF